MKRLCVIGSINFDLVVKVEAFPKAGETVTGRDFATLPGGKGANQAVAIGRLGGDVMMAGKVGDDPYGARYMENFRKNGVLVDGVVSEAGVPTGIALIEVDGQGENRIVIVPGANGRVDERFIDGIWGLLEGRDIFLLQLEIPPETVLYAARRLKKAGKTIILDPAPARPLPDELLLSIDYITPNESELQTLTGLRFDQGHTLEEAVDLLVEKGVKTVIAKAGRDGAYIGTCEDDRLKIAHIPAFKVEAVDTTAAGDSFNAGFAYALAEGREIHDAVRFANAVGALSTTAFGAQGAMPGLEETLEFIGRHGSNGSA